MGDGALGTMTRGHIPRIVDQRRTLTNRNGGNYQINYCLPSPEYTVFLVDLVVRFSQSTSMDPKQLEVDL